MLGPDDFLPLNEFVRRHPHLGSEGSHRWLIFNAPLNGLAESGAICRRGRRVFICVPRYIAWLSGEGRQQRTRAA